MSGSMSLFGRFWWGKAGDGIGSKRILRAEEEKEALAMQAAICLLGCCMPVLGELWVGEGVAACLLALSKTGSGESCGCSVAGGIA